MKKQTTFVCTILLVITFFSSCKDNRVIKITTLEELAYYAAQDSNTVKLAPGVYRMMDFLNEDSIRVRLERKQYPYMDFSGNGNTFDLKGVTLEIDTRLRKLLKHPIHTNELVVTGGSNTLNGLEIVHTGHDTSPGGATFCVEGKGNTVSGFTLRVQGSFPYGYGDLFGKGGPDVIRHQKHSGFLITGNDTRVLDTKLYMRSFGHGFYIQKSASDIYFENCYVEGELRSTNDILNETEGPAFDVKFRTWTANRNGEYIVTPGYMKSLCEEGFRTYNWDNKNITFINCTAKNTRGGFELRTNGGVRLENCTTIGTERAYWVGNGAIMKNCKGDANYGPLLFLEGSNVEVDLAIVAAESDCLVHSLITVQGKDNKVRLRPYQGKERTQPLPILIGYTHPEHGESMSPYGEAPCVNLHLINETTMPVVMGKEAIDCQVVSATPHENNQLMVYEAPQGALLNDDFIVKVRISGQEWQLAPSYLVKVMAVNGLERTEEEATASYFDFEGEVEVAVTYNKGKINDARIRPLANDIPHRVKGNTLFFTLNRPCNLSVEVNGDIFHNLHLFANPIDSYIPNPQNEDLIYFGPGIHNFEQDELHIPSGKTVYIAGGAILKGRLVVDNAESVNILGRGMICHTVKHGVKISNSKNILVEGIITTQCSTGGSNHVTIRNVKSISYYGWGDGMNVFASNHVLHDGVFCRNSDDCTTVYGSRKGYEGGCKNITMQNSVLWADVAHPIFIGIHGNADGAEILEDLNYKNIDILDHRESQIDYQGCLAINAGDNNLVRNVRFENIRIENFRKGQLVNIRIFYNRKYCKAPGRGIEDILFKDITYTGDNAEISVIAGYDADRKVKNIRFENLRVNGLLISDDMPDKPHFYKTSDMAQMFVGEHVENISFNVKP